MTDIVATDLAEVTDRLRHFGVNIERWRGEAKRLRQEAAASSVTNASDTESLVGLERTAGDIYDEIANFKETVAEIAATSPAAAGELAEIGEILHLLLLDITELGIKMYSTRSGVELSDSPAEPDGPKAVPSPTEP